MKKNNSSLFELGLPVVGWKIHCTAHECIIKMSRQKAITAFFCEKYGDHVQHNQCTSSDSVNLSASAEPVDLDEDYSIQTADAEPTLAKRRKLIKDHQGNSIVKLQCKFII